MAGELVADHTASGPGGRRLRIGVSANLLPPDEGRVFYPRSTLVYVEEQMVSWVSASGALPVLIPTFSEQSALTPADYVAEVDGLLLTGGADVCPRSYGEEPLRPEWSGDERRDRYEIDLVHRFVAAGKPVLGVCRGEQVLNVAFGGTMYQDVLTQVDTTREHRSQERYHHNQHEVDVVPGSWLASLYPGVSRARVNSIHHQAVKDPAPNVVVEARSADDGVIEAIRVDDGDVWARGVQWHPEFFALTPGDDLLDARPLLAAFLHRAATSR